MAKETCYIDLLHSKRDPGARLCVCARACLWEGGGGREAVICPWNQDFGCGIPNLCVSRVYTNVFDDHTHTHTHTQTRDMRQ